MWYEHLNILGLPFGDALANSLSFPITVLNWCLARLVIWLGKYSHSVQMAKLVTALGPHPLSLAYLAFLWAVSSLLGRFHYKYEGYVDPFAQAMDSVTSIQVTRRKDHYVQTGPYSTYTHSTEETGTPAAPVLMLLVFYLTIPASFAAGAYFINKSPFGNSI